MGPCNYGAEALWCLKSKNVYTLKIKNNTKNITLNIIYELEALYKRVPLCYKSKAYACSGCTRSSPRPGAIHVMNNMRASLNLLPLTGKPKM